MFVLKFTSYTTGLPILIFFYCGRNFETTDFAGLDNYQVLFIGD